MSRYADHTHDELVARIMTLEAENERLWLMRERWDVAARERGALLVALERIVGAVERMKSNPADGIADECRDVIKSVTSLPKHGAR